MADERATARPAPNLQRVALRCACGRALSLAGEDLACVCGRHLGARQRGVWQVGVPAAYWGEVPQERMEELLAASRAQGWRRAVAAYIPELAGYLADPRRAAFAELLPLLPGGCVLEIGAGLGGIATQLALEHDVIALEGVAERAEFLALRAMQDDLPRLRVICGDWHRVQFAPGQFDAIILNGVLEWVGVGDRSGSPAEAQVRFLRRVGGWLAPHGTAYLAIENRFGWPEWRGAIDHSGLPYTSLLPRWMARAVCRFWSPFRSSANHGYRTYTYSHAGYRRLLRRADLAIMRTYVCPRGYNLPVDLAPLHAGALRFQAAHRTSVQTPRPRLGWLRRQAARAWVYRWIGGDFAFFLVQAPGAEASAALPSGDRADA